MIEAKSINNLQIIPAPSSIVSVKQAGNTTEIKYMSFRSNGGTTKKISKDEYIDTISGEIKKFQHKEKRIDDIENIKKSFSRLRDIIRANCTIPENCLFITLTYRKNMCDEKKLYNDFKNFYFKRLPKNIRPYKWISIIEPQERGAWHIHIIFIYNNKAPFIPNSTIANAWKQGFVKVEAINKEEKSIDDIGAYLIAYITDIEISDKYCGDNTNIKTVIGKNGISKRYKKGARLYMYPSGIHLYRNSKNCIIPKSNSMTFEEANKLVYGHTLIYDNTFCIQDTDTGWTSIVNQQIYNSKRKAKK